MAHELEASQDTRLILRLFKNMRKVKCKSPHAKGRCWESTYGEIGSYAQIPWSTNGNFIQIRVHRLSWVYHNQEAIPDHLVVCHHCDNRKCLNPDHLFLGTSKDNMQDAINKGRLNRSGDDSPARTLNSETVRWIRLNCTRRILGYKVKRQDLVDRIYERWQIQIHVGTITRIINNRSWFDPNWDPKTKTYKENHNA